MTGNFSGRYVAVRDEPMHRRRFENEWVRVYDVLIPAGEKTLYHEHTEDTVYIALTEATFSSQKLGRETVLTDTSSVGDFGWTPHRTRPLIHEVGNTGDQDIRLIGAEIKSSTGYSSAATLSGTCWELGEEHERVRFYRSSLGSGESTGVIAYNFSRLTVMLSTAVVAVTGFTGEPHGTMVLSAGDVFWHRNPQAISIENIGEQPMTAVMMEWR